MLVLFGSAGGADIIHFSFIIQFEIVILEFLSLIRNRKYLLFHRRKIVRVCNDMKVSKLFQNYLSFNSVTVDLN